MSSIMAKGFRHHGPYARRRLAQQWHQTAQFERLEPRMMLDGIPIFAGEVHGLKWADLNGDGERQNNEPGLAGVQVYVDMDNNGRFDEGEPTALTRGANTVGSANDLGRYTIRGVPPGLRVVREVVPDGYAQTSPGPWAGLFETDSRRVGEDFSAALAFRHTEAYLLPMAVIDLATIVEHSVTWRDGCTRLIPDLTTVRVDGDEVFVEMYSSTYGGPCILALITQTQEVNLGDLPAGNYKLTTTLHESGPLFLDPNNAPIPVFRETWVATSLLAVRPDGGHVVHVPEGGVVNDVNFGNRPHLPPPLGAVHGRKFDDRNGNGQQDDNEPGLAGVLIYVDANRNGQFDENMDPFARTREDNPFTDFDEAGLYVIENVPPGGQIVREIVPAGYRQTFPESGFHEVTVPSGGAAGEVNFGNQRIVTPTGVVRGFKFVDLNRDGERQNTEPGLAGVVIYADLDHNGVHDDGEPFTHTIGGEDPATGVFAPTGLYFLNLPAGDYVIREVVPDGYDQTAPREGGYIVRVEPNAVVGNIDFGNAPIVAPGGGSIHGRKFHDINGNGEQDYFERGIPGIRVYVDLNDNGRFDPDEPFGFTMVDDPTTRFEEDGRYWIDGVPAGEHKVREVVPVWMVQTAPGVEARLDDVRVEQISDGSAIDYTLTGANAGLRVDGGVLVSVRHVVVWPDSCGFVIPEFTTVDVDDDSVSIDLYSAQRPGACAEVISPQTVRVPLGTLQPGVYELTSTLHEPAGELLPAFVPTWRAAAKLIVRGDGYHEIVIENGEVIDGLNFGNRRLVRLHGDVNDDGTVNHYDIDMLHHMQDDLPGDEVFDLNGDEQVDGADVNFLIRDVLHSNIGDLNLDGAVDIRDLSTLAANFGHGANAIGGGSAQVGWADGDLNGDGVVGITDLAMLATRFGWSNAVGGTTASDGGGADVLAAAKAVVVAPTANHASGGDSPSNWRHILDILDADQ